MPKLFRLAGLLVVSLVLAIAPASAQEAAGHEEPAAAATATDHGAAATPAATADHGAAPAGAGHGKASSGHGEVGKPGSLDTGKGFVNPAVLWEHTWDEVLIDLWVIGGLFGVVAVYMLFKFKAKSPDAVGTARPMSFELALAWCLVPVALFMADDFLLAAKGWTLWNVQRTVPAGAMEIKVTGNQWYFEYEYEDGTETDELVVPVGRPIVLRMTSNDVLHSFGLNEYRVKEDMMPGRITYIWFYADEPKTTPVVCVEFCGTNHSKMYNDVRAVPQAEFDAWLKEAADE